MEIIASKIKALVVVHMYSCAQCGVIREAIGVTLISLVPRRSKGCAPLGTSGYAAIF